MSLIKAINNIALPLAVCVPLVSRKIKAYACVLDIMDKHDGWLPYPDLVLKHLEAVGAKHWADLYFRKGIEKCLRDNKDQLIEFLKSIVENVGVNPSPEISSEFLGQLFKWVEENIKAFDEDSADSYYAQFDYEKIDVEKLTKEELKEQYDFWITFHISFFNDLALAVHGESIYSLVQKAVELEDDDALVKSIQIDRTLLPYYQDRLWGRTMKGDSDFFDLLGYRVKNPPRRGTNKHPLLWILFNDLYCIGCLRRSITSKQILDVYQKAIPDHPLYSIDDELTVQRQRRNFMKLYRQPK